MSRNGETVKNADEWALIFDEIGQKLEREIEKGREHIRSSAEKFKQEQEKEKQLKARYIDVYGATVGTVLYNEHLKRKEA